jgi:hypothetical protein
MRKLVWSAIAALCMVPTFALHGQTDDLVGKVKTALEKSTLDQPGAKPFHLRASFAPSFDRYKGSHRTGEIEIWWQSPNHWRRELRSPEFHQIAIVDGDHQWQKNDGEYFPDWLRQLATAIVRPVPLSMDVLLKRINTAEVRHLMNQTNFNWDPTTGLGDEQANGKGYLALNDRTGLLLYAGGPGFSGGYQDFKDFHGRMIAWKVNSGSVEVTATLSVLEDLGTTPNGFFEANASGGDSELIETVVLSEDELRMSLLSSKPFTWPPVTDGPLEGGAGTEIVLDRTGKIREMEIPIVENPALRDAAGEGFRSMQFKPVLRNGVPVQATGRLTVHFKTVRPAGMETFDTAKNYFERGRRASFLSAGSTAPYLLRAELQVGTPSGVQTGRYEDTWISATEWKREAWLGSSHLIRSQSGDKRFLLAEGAESGALRTVMMLLEPIPAEDTMTESDWWIRRDTVDGVKAIRVYRGEGKNGEVTPATSQAYWFDDSGHLIKAYASGFEIRPSNSAAYNGVLIARQIDVLKDGKVGLRFSLKGIESPSPEAAKSLKLKGHEWQRAFTGEVR